MKNHNTLNIFISIHPCYANSIMDGVKTIELRRRFPDLEGVHARLLVYATSPIQSLIGYADIKNVHHMLVKKIWHSFADQAQIEKNDFSRYFQGREYGYAVELQNPVKFQRPVPIDYLFEHHGIVPPQSYRYIKDELESIFSHAETRYPNTARYKYSDTNRRQQAN